MEAKIYNTKGKEAGKVALSEAIWNLPLNKDLVHQVAVSMQSNARTGTASVKDRSEVSGGGKKPWQQKGTGRARHGSSRSPLWRHGGVTHGPLTEKDYSKKINRAMRVKALHMLLAEKLRKNHVLFVDAISIEAPKTKDAKAILEGLAGVKGFDGLTTKKKNAAYIAAGEASKTTAKSFANFGSVEFDDVKNMNPVDLLTHKYLVIANPEKAVAFIEGKGRKSAN